MPRFNVIPARSYHCGQMARRLRAEHAAVVVKLGLNAHQELHERFIWSAFRRAWLIDGELAALGGVTGSPLETSGMIWLALSELATKYPVACVKEAKKQLAEIMATRHEITTLLLEGDEAARRFALALGFVPNGKAGEHSLMGIKRREAA